MPGLPEDHERFARAALGAYGRAPDTPLRLLSLSENATYLVGDVGGDEGCDDEPVVLRVHRPGYHSVEEIRSELDWMAALRTQTSVRTPELVPTVTGEPVTAAHVGDRMLYVDAVSYIAGCTAEEDPDVVGFDALGELTAIMHQHVQSWTAPAHFTRFRWDLDAILGPHARWGDWRAAHALTASDRAVIERAATEITGRLTEFGMDPDRFGLVHADLRLANLMVDPNAPESGITVIDFDDCGWSWHLADLGAVVSWIEDTPAAERIVSDWLSGYLTRRPLPPEDLAMIPTFVMLRRIHLTAWTASHHDADAAIAVGPEFATGTAALAHRYLDEPDWLAEAIARADQHATR
ncbi:phosphotransferase enzyme family protein [Mycolicibacterium confluentis]|uniref:Aminoglycoside phosphotransferase n=1 Tax=Mycolicibacterium confluentis TaxID=28047 RepID=A0A7I7Y3E2_9MYCO|nr:phosphotransferase [Mycolicibacterium confluentis]MCV7320504.1 phosphotransferase [Mycolicibacterium confluentis]ORV30164.1 aminoglycoside phosphotransferase [Mycolicibacterium confluentis]BBZ35542.1 aminoglycoside phosphotransferase [Mycolicibacterium confluentis]